MKKTVRGLAAILVLCIFVSIFTVSAFAAPLQYTDDYGTWDYEVENDGSITIVGFEGTKKNIVVPATIDGQTVRKLGDGLFKGNSGLSMISIPAGVREIGNEVFCNCDKLETVHLPITLEKIGDSAFADCASLETLYIPASVVQLGTKVFADNPNLEVTCDLNSAAATYLQTNRSEVASFVLMHYTDQTPAQPANPPVNNGEHITYSFGKLIGGQPEYTLELLDLKPDTELMNYLVQYGGQNFFFNKDQAKAAMDNRFHVISLKKFDGQKTTSYSQQNPSNISVSLWTESYNGSGYKMDINYSIFFNELAYGQDIPGSVTCNSKNELLTYTEYTEDSNPTAHKQDSSLYVRYNKAQRLEKTYFSDGSDSTDLTETEITAHIIPVEGHCSEIGITNTVIQPSNTKTVTKKADVYKDTDTEIRALSSTDFEMGSGKITKAEGDYKVYDKGQMVEDKQIDITFDNNEQITSFDLAQYGSEEELDAFKFTHTIYNEKAEYVETRFQGNNKYDVTVTENNWIYYSEQVGKAEDLTDFEEDLHNYFPNNANENTNMISDRLIKCSDSKTAQVTNTDMGNNTSPNNPATSYEDLSDHTYVGDTGKYVGWDWHWGYNFQGENDTKVLSQYMVTEYKYDTTSDTWNKTVAQVSAKNTTPTGIVDFKATIPVALPDLLDGYMLTSQTFVYDESLPSGANNWRPDNSQPGQMQSIADIVYGNTSLTDGKGNVLQQADVKEDMLELEGKLKQDITKGEQKNIPEQFVQDALNQLPSGIDGNAIKNTIEDASNGTQPLPEDNTQGKLVHEHDENGNPTTTIKPESAPEA